MTMKTNIISRRDWLVKIGMGAVLPLITGRLRGDAIGQTRAKDNSHCILSCNILLDLPEHKDKFRDWDAERWAICEKVIKSRNADIICLQEVGRKQNRDFLKAFPSYNAFGYDDPYVDGNPKRFQAIKNVILYSKDRYEQTSVGTYWLSKTPFIAGSRWPGDSLPRHVTWVRLKDRKSSREFRVLNTHWTLKQELRMLESQMIAEEARQYQPNFPQLLCGDFNSNKTSPEQKILHGAGWKDTYEAVHGTGDPGFTGHGFKVAEKTAAGEGSKIDFVFFRGNVKPVEAEIIRDNENGHYPSDHFFVSSKVEF